MKKLLLLPVMVLLLIQAFGQVTLSTGVTNVTCNGGSNGTAWVTASGGTTPYTYLWNNNGAADTISNLAPGVYTVTVTDASSLTASAAVSVVQPTALVATGTFTNVTCFGASNGSATVVTTGGTIPYTYTWNNSATTNSLSNLQAGTYSLTASDANNCSTTVTGTVTQPSQINVFDSTGNILCGASGSVTLFVSGGTAPYIYAWSNGSTVQPLVSVAAGTYTATVTDANGCSATVSATISGSGSAISLSNTTTNASCNGQANGSISVTASNGVAPYTYQWSNVSVTSTITNLNVGTYAVTVTDANGCTATAAYTITQPTAINVSDSTGNAACGANGSVTLFTNGGTSPYIYAWSNASTAQSLVSVAAGTYTATVTDANGCSATVSAIVSGSGSSISLSNTTTNAGCSGQSNGSISVTASNGVAPYTYIWSNSSTTSTITSLNTGTYTITVTDAGGCTATASYVVSQAAAINISDSTANATCGTANGSVTLFASGGTAPYTYAWSSGSTTQLLTSLTAGTYTATVTDANGCSATTSATINSSSQITVSGSVTNVTCNGAANGGITVTAANGSAPYTYQWSNSSTTSGLTGLNPGSYVITVTDAGGCSTTGSYIVTQPTQIIVNDSTGNASCGAANGSVTLFVNGGSAPYTYAWSNGTTAQPLISVQAGSYNVTLTDANGCTVTSSATVSTTTGLTISVSAIAVTCNGQSNGSVTATVAGGTAPYTYIWNNASTSTAISNLAPGTYTATVTDNAGCSATATGTVTQPAPITAAPNASNPTCGGTNGSVSVTVTGGTPAYTYLWSNTSTTSAISNLQGSTTYTVTVTDSHGCTSTASAVVGSSTQLSDSAVSHTNINCFGASTGALHIGVSGGSGSYIYNWSNGDSTAIISNLAAGAYAVTITDLSGGCSVTASYTLTQATQITISSNVTASTACYGSTPNGSVSLTASGGTSPYEYNWSNGSTASNLTAVGYDSLFVTVTDANGCTAHSNAYVSGKAQFTCAFTLSPDSLVAHKWFLNYTFTGSYPESFTWTWGDGDTSTGPQPTHTYTDSGFYNICMTLTDSAGCTANYCSNSTFLRGDTGTYLVGVVVIPPPSISTAVPVVNQNHFAIYPNPASDLIHISATMEGVIRYQVYNELGQLVTQSTSGSNTFDVPVNNLSSGLYFVRLKAGNNEATERFIKQ